MTNLPDQFREFLSSSSQSTSSLTVKNYLADTKQFIRWYESSYNQSFSPNQVTFGVLSAYKKSQTGLSASSMDRHMSSLRKFFKFLKLEGHISQDPFEENIKNQKPTLDPWRLKDFKNFLYVYNSSHLTIKNYIIDIRQFLSWVEEVSKSTDDWIVEKKTVFDLITPELVEEYKHRLVNQTAFSPASINRKLSSIRRFIGWAEAENLISKLPISTPNLAKSKPESLPSAPAVVPTYSAFPPLRLAQKVGRGAGVAFDEIFIIPIVALLEKMQHLSWLSKGKPVFTASQLPPLTAIERSRIGIGIKNLPKSFYAPAFISVKHFPLRRKLWHHARYTRPIWYKTYRTSPVSSYLNFAALVIFIAATVLTLYNAFFQKPNQSAPVLAAVPTAPLRILSFQGKLTDTQDVPITSPTALRFIMYNDDDASASARLWEERRVVTPDADGVFSVLLGSNTTGGAAALCNGNSAPNSPTGSCGIMPTLFSENAALWLGVTVGGTPELTPRQQIATVAYAANAETLQGLLPITNSTSQSNVVLALNSSGNLSIGGSATPTFEATGGAFTIKGQGVVISTTSNGNISLSPNGSGIIDLQRPIQNTTNNNNVASALGAVEVDDLFAVLATSSGQSAVTIDQGSTGPIISASVSGTARFTVDNSGGIFGAGNLDVDGSSNDIAGTLNLSGNVLSSSSNLTVNAVNGYVRFGDTATPGSATGDDDVFIEGDLELDGVLYADGTIDTSFSNDGGVIYANSSGVLAQTAAGTSVQCLIGGSTPSFASCPSGSTDVFWSQTSGALYANNSTVDFLVGGQATTSAKFAVLNLNSGTPTASISANSGNGATFLTGTGNLGTTNKQTLTIGGSTTGDIVIDSGNITLTGPINDSNSDVYVTDNLNPTTDATYDLGDTTTSWRNIYLTGTLCFDDSDCATGWSPFINFWQQTGGALLPNNSTVDFLVGGQATTSAKFAVLNVNSGTPTASLSAGAAGGAYLTATGTLQTTAAQTLNLGGSTTGNVVIDSGSSSITLSDNTSLTGNLSLTGTISDSNSNLVLDDTVDIGSATTGINISTTGLISDSDGNVVIGDTVDLGSATTGINVTTTGVISDSDGNISLNDNTDVTGNLTLTGTLSDSDSDLSIADHLNPTTDATYNLGSTTSSWQDLYLTGQICFDDTDCFSTATAAGIWDTTNGVFYPKGPYTGVVDLLLGSNATASAKFAVLNINSGTPTASISANSGSNATFLTGAGNLGTTNAQTLTLGGSTTGNIVFDSGSSSITLSDNTTLTGNLSLTGTVSDSDSNLVLDDTVDIGSATTGLRVATSGDISDIDGDVSITDNTNITGNLDVSGTLTSGTANAFTVAADGAITTVTNETINGIDVSAGAVSDITTLSASGAITFSTFTSNGGVLYTNGSGVLAQVPAGTASQCLIGGSTPSFASCGTGSDAFWNQGSGALFPNNSSVDFLIGAQATTSAKFAVLNVNSGTPTASISANSGDNATTLTGTGVLGTTNGQTLTLGNSTTGNIVINAGADTITLSDNTNLSGNFTLTGTILDSNSNLVLDDTVDIGSATTGVNVTTTGVISDIDGNLSLNDNTDITGDVTLTGTISDSNSDVSIADHLDPSTDNTFDLGDTTTSWRNLYVTGNICFDDTDCFDSTGAAVGLWFTTNSAFYPKGPYTAVVDLLLGSTATVSAKFGFLNVNSGTPTASISANSGDNATTLTGTGVLGTTNGQTLTLGNSTTGNIVINAGADTITLSDNTVISGDLAVNGATSADITSTTTTASVFDATVTTLNIGAAATTWDIGAGTGTGTINNATLAITGLIDANGSGTHDIAGTLNLSGNTLTASTDLTIDASGGQVFLADADTLIVGGETAKAYNVFGDSADEADEAAIDSDDDLYIGGNLEVDGTIYANLSGTATDLNCTTCVDLTTEVSGVLPTANGGTNKALSVSNGGIVWSDTDSLEILAGNANSGLALVSGGAGTPSWFAPTAGSVIFAGTNGALTQDNTNFYWDDASNKLGIGKTPVGKLDVSGAVTGKALVIFDETGDQNIFTASASGATKLSIGRTAGALVFEGATTDLITTTLTPVDPTSSSKSINIPNASGTIAVSASSPITLSALGDIGCATCLSTSTTLFTLDGDDATTETISSGDTLLISGGTNGIDTDVSATDTITLNFDSTEVGSTTWGSGSGITWTFDASAGTDTTVAYGDGSVTTTLSATGLFNVLTGNLKIGNGTPGTSQDGEDAYVEGLLEVDGTSNLDGALNVGGITTATGNVNANGGLDVDDAFVVADGGKVSTIDISDTQVELTGANTTFNATGDITLTAGGGNIISGSPINIGHASLTAAAYNYFADSIAGNGTAVGDNDLYIEDDLEVDGTITGNIVGNVTGTATDLNCDPDGCVDATDLDATLTFADGDYINLAAMNQSTTLEGLRLPQATDCTTNGTVEGVICWDSDSDILYVGDGAAAVSIGNPFGVSIDNAEITADTIDWTAIDDTMELDADTSIAAGAGEDLTFAKTFTDATSENGLIVNLTASDTSAGTTAQYGLYIDNLASTEGADALIALNNADADDAVRTGILFTAGGAGTDFTTGVDFSAANLTREIVLENGEAIIGQSADTITFEDDDGTDYATLTATALTIAGDLAITGGNITTAVTANSTLTITGTLTANGALDSNGDLSVADTNIAFDGASTTFTTTGAFTLTPGGAMTFGDGGDSFAVDTTEFDITAGTGAITINDGGDAGNITIEGTVLDINSLDFAGVGTITTTGSTNLTLAAGTGYVRVGDTGTPGSASGDDDLYVEGDLEVDGVFYADGGIDTAFTAGSVVFAGTSGVLAEDNSNFYWDDSNNRLGIGTTVPINIFQVTSAASTSALLSATNNGGDVSLGFSEVSGSLNEGAGVRLLYDGTNNELRFQEMSGADIMTLERTSLEVGIGTINPIASLHVTRPSNLAANGKALAIFDQIENQDIFTASASAATRFVIANDGDVLLRNDADGATDHLALTLRNADAIGGIEFETPSVTSSGEGILNFGIGTERGIGLIASNPDAGWFRVDTRASARRFSWYWEGFGQNSEIELMTLSSNGNLGIIGGASSSPSAKLHVRENIDGAGVSTALGIFERYDPNTPLDNFGGSIGLYLGRGDLSVSTESARIATVMTSVANRNADLRFSALNAGTLTEFMQIKADGLVVVGDITTDGDIATTAEELYVEGDIETNANLRVDGIIYAVGNSIQSSTLEALSISADDVSVVGCLNVGSATECTTQGNAQLSGDIAVNGDDITSDGNLTLAATGYVRVGDTGTPGTATGDDDLYVESDLEVDGNIEWTGNLLDSTCTAGTVCTGDGVVILSDTGDGDEFGFRITDQSSIAYLQPGHTTVANAHMRINQWLSSASNFLQLDLYADQVAVNGEVRIQNAAASGVKWDIFEVEDEASCDTVGTGVNAICFDSQDDAGTTELRIQASGNLTYTGTNNPSGNPDYAEAIRVTDSSVEPGDIVSSRYFDADESYVYQKAIASKSTSSYSMDIIGAISDDPASIISAGRGSAMNYQNGLAGDERALSVAGRVPIKVTSVNGNIKAGDAITSSDIAGVGMKATKAGRIVGIALHDYSNDNSSQIGKVLVLINPSWYDPDVYIAGSGNVSIIEENPEQFAVRDANSQTISRISLLSEAVIGSLKTGLVRTQKLVVTGTSQLAGVTAQSFNSASANIGNLTASSFTLATDSMTIAGETLHDYIAGVVEEVTGGQSSGNFTSPIASVRTLEVDTIKPNETKKVSVKLQPDEKFEVRNASDAAVVEIDSDGNASFSGRLAASSIETNDASLSGTLRAKKIIADEIEGFNASNSATNVTNNYYYGASQSGSLAYSDDGYISVASFAAQLAQIQNLNTENAVFSQSLVSYGTSTFFDMSVASQISIGAQFTITDTAINVLGDDLQLQPLKQGGIAFVGGEVYIDPSGNMTIKGNATFARDVEVQGRLSANIISPLPGKDLTVDLASGSGQLNIAGNVSASGSGTFGKLNLGLISPALAVSDTEEIASGSAGVSQINAFKREMTISNSLVTENSLIYITPTSNTGNQVLYLLRQEPGVSFTVGVQNSTNETIPFNWIIIN